jgi:hypothetical protein
LAGEAGKRRISVVGKICKRNLHAEPKNQGWIGVSHFRRTATFAKRREDQRTIGGIAWHPDQLITGDLVRI